MKNYRLADIQQQIHSRKLLYPIDILVVGATGNGKSATLNALFGSEVAKVGTGVEPETQHISDSRLNKYLRFHDSAGLGDGIAADRQHSDNLATKLKQQCFVGQQSYGFIDLVLVVLDASSRDLGTTFKLLEQVILKHISADRIAVIINQADLAMKGRHWYSQLGLPAQPLLQYLEQQAASVCHRIAQSTGCHLATPVFYSATEQYNIDQVMEHIIAHLPAQRRFI